MIQGVVLNPGTARGPTLVLTEPLSFWGAYEPRTGCIIDTHHAQSGAQLGGHVLLMPETRGSGTAPGAIAEAIRLGTAPLAIILITPDINVAIGAAVAGRLYDRQCPVIAVAAEDYQRLLPMRSLAITATGLITGN